LAERLRDLRTSGGLSCREVARLADISPGLVSIIERSRPDLEARELTTKTLSRLARVFGCTLDWLYLGVGKRPSNGKIGAAVARAEERRTDEDERRPKATSKVRLQAGHARKMKAHTAERNGRAAE
jgi:transcriptional regulator with XRE-family HTH domain